MRSALGVSLLLALSCARPPDSQPSAAPTPRAVASSSVPPPAAPPSKFERDADGFVYARVEKSAASLPARFAAPLPTSLEEFERSDAYSPPGQVSRALRGRSAWAIRACSSAGSTRCEPR